MIPDQRRRMLAFCGLTEAEMAARERELEVEIDRVLALVGARRRPWLRLVRQ